MRLLFTLTLITSYLIVSSCVKPRIYKAELAARSAAEAREKVLTKELLDRKNEASSLIKQVGDLNRKIGEQENEVSTLRSELSSKTQVLGASTNKLSNEKADLEKELSEKNILISSQEKTIRNISDVIYNRKKIVADIDADLAHQYASYSESGVTISIVDETIQLTLPDKILFDANGLSVSSSGKNLLMPLAEFLSSRPSLDVDLIAYTDNILPPREKSLKDTWDWSLQRATNITRMLIREFNTNANQLTPIGRGEFYPTTSNETAEGRQKNRRTIIVLRPELPDFPLGN